MKVVLGKPHKMEDRNKLLYILGDKRFTHDVKTNNVSFLYPSFEPIINQYGNNDFIKRFKTLLDKFYNIKPKRITNSNYFNNFESKSESKLIMDMYREGYNHLEKTWMDKIKSNSKLIEKFVFNLSETEVTETIDGNKRIFTFPNIDIKNNDDTFYETPHGFRVRIRSREHENPSHPTVIIITDNKVFLKENSSFFLANKSKFSKYVSEGKSLEKMRKYFYDFFSQYIEK